MKHWRPSWWQWILLITVTAVAATWGTLAAIRQQGIVEWRAYEAEAATAGIGSDAQDFLSGLEPVDAALQEDWSVWSEAYRAVTGLIEYQQHDLWSVLNGDETFSREFSDFIATNVKNLQTGRALACHPDLTVTLAGYAAIGASRGTEPWEWHIPSLLAARDMAALLQHEMVFGTEPASAIRDSAQFRMNLQPSSCLMDAMIAIAAAAVRDEGHLAVAWIGREGADVQAWLKEPPGALQQLAQATEGERTLFTGEFIARVVDGRTMPEWGSFGWGGNFFQEIWVGMLTWTFTPQEGAQAMREFTIIADRFRGDRSQPFPDLRWTTHARSPLIKIAVPYLKESGITAWEADVSHRLYRLAARLVLDASTQGLPADQSAWKQRYSTWSRADGDHPELVYERLAVDRFRIAVDPATTYPDFVDPARYTGSLMTDHGRPAASDLVVIKRLSIEMQINPNLPELPTLPASTAPVVPTSP